MNVTDTIGRLRTISTATISMQLYKRGIRRAWMQGPAPLAANQPRIAGPAFTMRFVPMREDLATPAHWASPRSTRAAIEEMPEGSLCVIDARGNVAAGCFGDILAARMRVRGVVGMVTDGAVRDAAAVRETGLPAWCGGSAAPASVAELHFVGWQEAIGCGGVAVMPGDMIVADGDGAVAIPADLADEVARDGAEQEAFETWAQSEVEAGAALPGLYPPNDETRARFDAWRAAREAAGS